MTTVTVAGFDTPSIHAARDAAGINGTVIFPPGTYDANGVTASLAGQTWRGEGQGATLLRSPSAPPSAVVIATAPLFLRNLTFDGNRGNNPVPGNGIDATMHGSDLDISECVIQHISNYGICAENSALVMVQTFIQDTLIDAVRWSSTGTAARRGPQIDRCFIDRSMNGLSPQGGGIAIFNDSNVGATILDPRVTNTRIIINYPGGPNSCLIGAEYCQNLHVIGNTLTGGHTSISVGPGTLGDVIANNLCEYPGAYGVEYGGARGIISGNNIYGAGLAMAAAICGNGCTHAKAIGNNIIGCSTGVQIIGSSGLSDIDNT
jgi:hypothetical protein